MYCSITYTTYSCIVLCNIRRRGLESCSSKTTYWLSKIYAVLYPSMLEVFFKLGFFGCTAERDVTGPIRFYWPLVPNRCYEILYVQSKFLLLFCVGMYQLHNVCTSVDIFPVIRFYFCFFYWFLLLNITSVITLFQSVFGLPVFFSYGTLAPHTFFTSVISFVLRICPHQLNCLSANVYYGIEFLYNYSPLIFVFLFRSPIVSHFRVSRSITSRAILLLTSLDNTQ